MFVDAGTITPREDVPANAGGALCQKGWTAGELLGVPDRVTVPLMRAHRKAPLEAVSWDAALDRITAEVRRIQRVHGFDAVAVFGYRKIDDPAAREHVARVWGVDPGDLPGPGLSAFELLAALGTPGGPRAMLVFGSNPVVSAPDSARVEARLDALEFLAVADFVPSETAVRADVVLPTTQWTEETGTVTNLGGRRPGRLRRRRGDHGHHRLRRLPRHRRGHPPLA
jgi:predicted molibdopterin-dependent oxidoreductase YjgC